MSPFDFSLNHHLDLPDVRSDRVRSAAPYALQRPRWACDGADLNRAGLKASFSGYDRELDRSDLVVLDANEFGGDPVAVVQLPRRVPIGFHGSWVAD